LYAKQALDKTEVSARLDGRLVYGTNVRQVLSYVERGEASAGIIYASDAFIENNKIRVVYDIPPNLHTPILYPAAAIKSSQNKADAEKFFDYLLTDAGQKTMAGFGLMPPQKP